MTTVVTTAIAPSTESCDLTPSEARALYRDDLTVREARARYFARSGFDERTYTARWIELPVHVLGIARTARLPNIAARRAAVRVHDLNHLLTGYGTDWRGEFQISAYELGMGCRWYWAAWALNAGGLAAGVFRAPATLVRAFARGRATTRSLYEIVPRWDDAILDRPVGDLRAAVGIVDDVEPTATDVALVAAIAVVSWVLHLAPVALAIAGLVALMR
jgi:hypothetical protein